MDADLVARGGQLVAGRGRQRHAHGLAVEARQVGDAGGLLHQHADVVGVVRAREVVALLARLGDGERGQRRVERAVVEHRPARGDVHAGHLERVRVALDALGQLARDVHLHALDVARLGILEAEARHVDLRAHAQHVCVGRAAREGERPAGQREAGRGQRRRADEGASRDHGRLTGSSTGSS